MLTGNIKWDFNPSCTPRYDTFLHGRRSRARDDPGNWPRQSQWNEVMLTACETDPRGGFPHL